MSALRDVAIVVVFGTVGMFCGVALSCTLSVLIDWVTRER